MLKNLWIEYWWILASLLFIILIVILMVFLAGRGMLETAWPKITLAIMCVIILLIPAMHPPGSYVDAVIVVLSLLILFRGVFKSKTLSTPSGESGDLESDGFQAPPHGSRTPSHRRRPWPRTGRA